MGKKKAKSKEPASDAEVNLLQSSSSSTQPEDPSPTAVHAHTLERRDQARDSFGHMNRIMNVFKLHAESKTVKAMKIALADVPRVQQLWGVVLVMEDQRRKNVNSEREKRGKADEPLELLIPDIDENELHQMYTAAKELARAKRENRAATLEYQEVKWLSEIYEYWPRNFVFDTNRKKGGILEPFVRFLKPTEYSKNGINKDALLPRPSVLDQNEMDSNEWICQYIFTLTPGTAEASLADIPDCLNPLMDIEGQKSEKQLLKDYQVIEEEFKKLNGSCREFIGPALSDLNIKIPRVEISRVLPVVLLGIKNLVVKNRDFVLRITALEHSVQKKTTLLEMVFLEFSREFPDLAEKFKIYADIKQDSKLALSKKGEMISNKASEIKTQNRSMGKQVEDLKKKLSVFENQAGNYVTQLREKDNIIDKDVARIYELEEKLKISGQKNTALEEKVENLEREKPALEREKAAVDREEAALHREKAAIEREKVAMERENGALKEKVENLEREKAAVEREKVAVEREKVALEREKVALEEKVENLERENTALDEALAKLTPA